MKSMTVHKMDDILLEAIKSRAEEQGESINATIKKLLAKALDLESGGEEETRKTGYRRFLGRWTAEEAAEFDRSTADFELVDPRDWVS